MQIFTFIVGVGCIENLFLVVHVCTGGNETKRGWESQFAKSLLSSWVEQEGEEEIKKNRH